MTYCDSSFLTALYITPDTFHSQAGREATKFTGAIPYTLLNELELLNTLSRVLGNHSIDQTLHDTIIREIETDKAEGILHPAELNQIKLYEKARELSRKHTSALACRSLDILHVASALVLKANSFASFDFRQRKLAAVAHLTLVPAHVR